MLTSPPQWPPQQKRTVRCATVQLLSLHQLPKRKEARPLYEPHHAYVNKLNDTSEPPSAASVSSPALTVELFSIGGYSCTAAELPPPKRSAGTPLPTRMSSTPVFDDGLHPQFNLKVHCLAAEPAETLLRVSVQDLTHSSVQDSTVGTVESALFASNAKVECRGHAAADHQHDVAYEAVVLDALRPGYRCLPLRSRVGCRINMCCVYMHVSISEVEVDDVDVDVESATAPASPMPSMPAPPPPQEAADATSHENVIETLSNRLFGGQPPSGQRGEERPPRSSWWDLVREEARGETEVYMPLTVVAQAGLPASAHAVGLPTLSEDGEGGGGSPDLAA